MNQRLYVESKKEEDKLFLRKTRTEPKNPICLNMNKFFWSIQDEKEELPSTKSHFLDISNQVVPIADLLFEKKVQESIKSILCPNFLADRNGLFNKLLKNKVNQKAGSTSE